MRSWIDTVTLAGSRVRVTVPSRRRERAKHLILLPTVDVVEADVMAPGVLEGLSAGKQAVVNLVGILHGRRVRRAERGPNDYGPDFARAHVELPQAIVAACRANGVRRFLHMSALGASPTGPSEYQRSKGIGELYGDVLEDNAAMRGLCRTLGFAEAEAGNHVIRVTLPLGEGSRVA